MPANLPRQNPPSSAISLPSVRFSDALVAAVKTEKNAHDATILPYLPRAVVHEAHAVAQAMQARYLAAPTTDELRNFLSDLYDALNASVRNPADERALSIRVGIACSVLADVPRVVLSGEFERFCFARCKFLPSPADMLEMAEDYAKPWRDKTTRVQMIITHDRCKRFKLGPPPEETKTQEQTASRNEVRSARKSVRIAFPSHRESRHA